MEATGMAMTLEAALAQLAALGDPKRRAINAKNGAGEKQYGVPMGEIRKLAAAIKSDHVLGLALWGTGNIDAQLLGTLLIKPEALTVSILPPSWTALRCRSGRCKGKRQPHRP
jgi:hypothetical protein